MDQTLCAINRLGFADVIEIVDEHRAVDRHRRNAERTAQLKRLFGHRRPLCGRCGYRQRIDGRRRTSVHRDESAPCRAPISGACHTQVGGYGTGENTLAGAAVERLQPGMLCLADRGFFSYDLWNRARAGGADLLWRLKKDLRFPVEQVLPDGSFLSRIYPASRARRQANAGIRVRVIEYRLEGVEGAEPSYRLLTTILEPGAAPAEELAALYHERWEIEGAFDELKTHLRGAQIILRSKTPDLVRQEFYGLLLAHFAVRGLMHEAALEAGEDPDRLSFLHAVRVIRRKLPLAAIIPPSAEESVP